MVSVVMFMASPRPCGVTLSFGLSGITHPLLWGVSVKLHCFVFVKIQRELEGYTTVPPGSIRKPQRLVQKRTLQDVFLQCTPGTITLIHLELADRTASRHQDFGDPVEDFDREEHGIFPDMWQRGFATLVWTESTVLQHFPGRPCPDKSLNGNGNYGGN